MIPGFAADQAAITDVDISGYLEDKIATLVSAEHFTPAGVRTTSVLDANHRMYPLPAGTTVAAGHIRLVDWQTINPGTALNSEDTVALTVLYLKDSAGKFP